MGLIAELESFNRSIWIREPDCGQHLLARRLDDYGFQYTKMLGESPNPEDYPLPSRSTSGSVGYDLCSPFDAVIPAGKTLEMPLGIKCRIPGWVFLMIVPRSSMGFHGKHVALTNTIGIIDPDYCDNPGNEGQLSICLRNFSDIDYRISKGDRIAQAIIVPLYSFDGDEFEPKNKIRKGGFGSTGI